MATIAGTSGPDTLAGDAAADVINGLGGNDRINGGQGHDTLSGGAGDDSITDGLAGSQDTASDVDNIYGGAGNDTIVSNQGLHFQDNDTISGGDGDDPIVLNGVQTGDPVDGGAGIDTADIRFSETIFQAVLAVLDPTGFIIHFNGVNTVFLAGIERLFIATGRGNDSLAGGALGDSLGTTGGTNTIEGRGGDDVVTPDLFGGAAVLSQVLDGGAGTDILSWTVGQFDAASHVFDLAAGTFTRAGVSPGTITGFERLFMSAGNGADTLTGGAQGSDSLSGRDGADSVAGGAGNDLVRGDSAPVDAGIGFGSGTVTKGAGLAATRPPRRTSPTASRSSTARTSSARPSCPMSPSMRRSIRPGTGTGSRSARRASP